MAYDELLGMAPTARRGLVDSMVQSNRAATPALAQEQRKAQRYSIAELNSMDLPEIKARWSADPLDTRGAGTRVLDMIDLPRNTVANLLFKATGVVKDDPRNTAALGLQRVSVSDALEALGVENRIVRGVAGFVGDVALDPITYLGPPGWGAKGVSTAGRVARVGATGAKEISAAAKAAAAGKAVADPALAKFVSLSGAAGDAAKTTEALYSAGKPMWKRFGEFFGADKSAEGLLGYADPLIARTGTEAEKQAAAMDFVRRYGPGTAPGIRIGKDAAGKWGIEFAKQGPGRIKSGSALAHIPFTEYSLSVPALTGDATYGLAAQTLREMAESPDPGMAETLSKVQGLDDLARQGAGLLDQVKATTGDDRRYAMHRIEQLQGQAAQTLKEVESTLLTQQDSAAAVSDPRRLLYLGRLRDTAQALGQKIAADTGRWLAENSEGLGRWKEINPLLQQRTEELVQANMANEGNRVADARKAGAKPFRDEAAKVKALAEEAAQAEREAREKYKQAWDATDGAMHETSALYSIDGDADPRLGLRFTDRVIKQVVPRDPKKYNPNTVTLNRSYIEDRLAKFGSEYVPEINDVDVGLTPSQVRDSHIAAARQLASEGASPELAYLDRVYQDTLSKKLQPSRFVAIQNPEGLRPGTSFRYLGNEFEVAEDGTSIVAKSVDTNKAADIPLDGIEHLFVDKGTIKHTVRGKGKMGDAARKLDIGDTGYIAAEKIYMNPGRFTGTQGPTWDAAKDATDSYIFASEARRTLDKEARKLESLANQVEEGIPARRKVGYNEIEARTGVPEDSFRAMNERLRLQETFGTDPNVYAMPRSEDELRKASAAEAAEVMKKNLDDAAAWIVDMTPEEQAARVAMADAIHSTANAAKALADATGAPLLSTMRGADVNLRRAAELALGFTPDMLGNGVMMSMARALDGILGPDSEAVNFLSRADAASGRMFGRRESALKDLAREYSRWATANSPATEKAAADRIVELAGIAEKYGVPPEKLDELNSAYLMAMFAKSDPNLAAFSPKDPIHELLKSARSGGLLDRGTNPELVSVIESLAERDAGMLSDYLNVEQRMGRIGVGMDNYVPNVLTSEARNAARSQRQSFYRALGGQPNVKGDVLEEFFAKPRSTYVYDIGGRDYLAGSLEVMRGMKPEDVARLGLDPVAEKSLMELKSVQEAFDALPPDVQPKPRPASQFYINQLVDSGQLAMITGGRELTKGFFEVSPPLIMAARTAAHERAKIRTYFDQVVRNMGIPYNERIAGVTAQQAGAEFKTLGGATGKISKDSGGSVRVTIGTQRFRTVSPDVLNSGSDLLDAKSGKLTNVLLPERAADAVESFYKVVGSDLNPIMSAIDGATKYWKSATLLHPSWMIGDLVGGVVLMAGMGITPAEMTKHGAAALKMVMRGSPETLAKMRVPLGGVEAGGEQLAKEIADAGVLHGSRNAEAVAHILHDGMMLSPAQYSLLRNPKEAAHEIASRGQMRARAMAYGNLSGEPNFAQKAKGLVLDEVYLDRLWKPWVRLNGKVNDWMRSTAYLAMRDRGFDPTTAARAVQEGLLDMSSLTDVESNMLRRLIPFYSWMKASAVHGLRQAYQNPKYFSIYPHAARAFEEMTAGDQRVPEYARPRWMRDQIAIQVGADPSSRMAFMSGTLLPQEAALRWASGMASPLIGAAGIQDLAGYVASGVTPLLRAPMEIGFGQEFYSGRTIRPQEGQGDFTPGEYLLSQIRPLREFGVGQVRQGAIQSAADRGVLQAAGRVLFGGRFQPFDDERLKFNNIREFKEAETQIRKRVNIAERDGNKEASAQARTALLKLYESMQIRGLEDQVPKWARSQLPQVSSN